MGTLYLNDVGRSEIAFIQQSGSGLDSLALAEWAAGAFGIFEPTGCWCFPIVRGRARGLMPVAEMVEP